MSIDVETLKRAASAVYMVIEEQPASDLSEMLKGAANEIESLRDEVSFLKEELAGLYEAYYQKENS